MSDVQIAVVDQQDTQIVLAVPGVQGATGSEIPTGGTADQVLRKSSSTNYDTNWSQVTSAMIADGTIVNADINASAAIAGTKISPDFGSQNVVTTGTSTAASFIPTSSTVPTNGVYLPAANSVALSTNGTGRLFVDANGTVRVNSATQATSDGGLNVEVTSNGSSSAPFTLQNRGTSNGTGVFLTYRGLSSASAETDYAYMQMLATDTSSRQGAIAFWTANGGSVNERLRITSAGLVGIGTSSPSEKLDVFAGSLSVGSHYVATVNTDYKIRLRSVGPNTNNNYTAEIGVAGSGPQPADSDITFATQTWNGSAYVTTEKARLTATGRLGIGTASPSGLLNLSASNAAGYVSQILDNTNATGYVNQVFRIGSTGASGQAEINYAPGTFFAIGPVANDTTTPIVFRNNNATERARIDSSGRLLVGTSSSLLSYSKLQVQGGAGTDPGGHLCLANENAAPSNATNIGSIRFTNNAGGIGATVGCEADGAWTAGSNYRSRLVFSTTADGESSPTERMRIGNDGRTSTFCSSTTNNLALAHAAGAGTTYKLIEGAYGATGVNTGTESFRVYTNGNVQNTNNSYGAISDVKLKENIVDAASQWDDIKALQVRKYNFKEGQTHTQIGLVAQEVELVSPGLVSESPDRDAEGNDLGTVTKSVNYSVLYMKAVKALQEAMERIETLEAKVAALESA